MANIEGIQITLGELTQVASTIRTLNTNLNSCLEEIQRKMNALSESWSSEASETIRAKFTSILDGVTVILPADAIPELQRKYREIACVPAIKRSAVISEVLHQTFVRTAQYEHHVLFAESIIPYGLEFLLCIPVALGDVSELVDDQDLPPWAGQLDEHRDCILPGIGIDVYSQVFGQCKVER